MVFIKDHSGLYIMLLRWPYSLRFLWWLCVMGLLWIIFVGASKRLQSLKDLQWKNSLESLSSDWKSLSPSPSTPPGHRECHSCKLPIFDVIWAMLLTCSLQIQEYVGGMTTVLTYVAVAGSVRFKQTMACGLLSVFSMWENADGYFVLRGQRETLLWGWL